ncbi:hypothetical protein QAD02_020094 [Eretmocerus hayati]|uniref:Uncharacterized protein n=1 Tax=Eretmocerus hayati TaxID=131215 RepID=A0ACC2PLI6_9HYME|nr:hypothetical protein QAD02_020094 [Eretmocerus hayati]
MDNPMTIEYKMLRDMRSRVSERTRRSAVSVLDFRIKPCTPHTCFTMKSNILVVLPVAVFILFALVAGQETVPKACIGCICEAASGCNTTTRCSGDICGPFHITWSYWADAGKPTVVGDNSEQAFANCANDIDCASRIVQGYMTKYAKDCNGDGIVNCDDYVRIHYLGGYGCSGTLLPRYENAYRTCKATFPDQFLDASFDVKMGE